MIRIVIGIVLILLVSISPGCYCQAGVETSEKGLVMPDGVQVQDVVGPGRYTDLGPFSGLKAIDLSAKTLEWSDPDLVTNDKQPIGLSLAVTYARKNDAKSIQTMWELYRAEASNNEALASLVRTRVPAAAKEITARYTLDQMLGTVLETEKPTEEEFGRGVITQRIQDLLKPQLDEIFVELLDVRISNIGVDPAYMEKLKEKARADIEREIAEKRVFQLQAQLQAEKATTEIELEIARRNNLVNQEKSKVLDVSDRYFELERLRAWQEIIGGNDKLFFIPAGTDLQVFLGMDGRFLTIEEKP